MTPRAKDDHPMLAGDIGGTHSRLALFRVGERSYRFIAEKTFSNKDYSGLEIILRQFLQGQKVISACFGVAGPVTGRTIKITNLQWAINVGSIEKELSVRKLEVINDLVANAYGISMLKKKDFEILNRGKRTAGNAALLSAGTGLGVGILSWDGVRYVPSPSEGGHVEFGPRNQLEIELLAYLQERFDHVSYERILSGQGLFHIYQFLRDRKRAGREPQWLSERIRRGDPAAVISEAAKEGRSSLCTRALDLFVSVYGAAAGNLALFSLAFGGVYIGGGIAPKIIWKLRDGTFMAAFKDKGRLSDIVSRIPVKVIMNEKAALLGAAYCATETQREG